MTRDEALSRLLADDLPAAEAAAWRARIANDPEVAAAWAALQLLSRDLEALPAEPVPEALIARVVRQSRPVSTRPARWPRLGRLFAVAAALAVVVWAAMPTPRPTVELVRGEQRVVGDVRMVAGGVPIHVDGAATIRVEPQRHPVREVRQEGSMRTESIVSFGAGVLVTVAVTQGVAWVTEPDQAVASEVVAGQTRTVGVPPAPGALAAQGDAVVIRLDETASAEDRTEALEKAIAELTFERDILRGQLVAAGGEELPWPDDLPAELGPEQFEATLQAALGDFDAQIVEVDCSEYPCLAVLDGGPIENPMTFAQDLSSTITDGVESSLPDDVELSMGIQVEASDHGDGLSKLLVGVAVGTEGTADPRDVRVQSRLQAMLEAP